jgi:hypothetical protein
MVYKRVQGNPNEAGGSSYPYGSQASPGSTGNFIEQ